MKRLTLAFFGIGLAFLSLQAQGQQFIPQTIVVKYSSEKSAVNHQADFESICKTKAKRTAKMFNAKKQDKASADINRIYRIEYDGNTSPIVIAKKMAQCEGVEYAEPYWIPETLDTPNDPKVGSQYYLNITKALEAHDITQGDTNFVIGIVDTGFDVYHEDLSDNISINYADPINGIDDDGDGYIDNYRGWDMACNDNNPISTVEHHGTYVAGCAVATTNNGIGIASVGYKCRFLPVKVSEDEKGLLTACYEGIVYCADHGCKVINCSWGSPAKSLLCDDVIKYAQSRGCLIVAAAGNTGTDVKYYPAACDGVICVSATNASDNKWKNSTYNHRVDISAPGEAIHTTYFNNSYQTAYGTSLSSPIVAGASALVWTKHPDYTATQIGELLRVTADIIDTIPANAEYAGKLGSGRLNVLKALTDSTSPSLRITDYSFTADNNEFVSGAELKAYIEICNYLKQVSSVTVTLTSPDNSAIVNTNALKIDTIDTFEKCNLSFSVTLADSLPVNYTVPFQFNFKANGYSASQTLELIINPTFKDIEWGEMECTIADNGKIGIYDYDAQLGKGFIYQKKYDLISDGALILALDEDRIASAFQTDNEFTATAMPEIFGDNDSTWAKSTIKPVDINGISILQKFVFDGKNLPNAMICDYSIINSRKETFENACVGLFFDWDVVNSLTNNASFDDKRNMGYIYNYGNETFYSGICLLTNGNAVPYVFEMDNDDENNLNVRDEFTNEQKWEAMNNANPTSTKSNFDLAHMLSCNKIEIKSNDTANVRFAIMCAENLYELNRIADKAIELYGDHLSPHTDTGANSTNSIFIYPNPVKSTLYVESSSEIELVRIFSSVGILELEEKVGKNHRTGIDIMQLSNGAHIVEVVNTDGRTSRRLVVK